MSTYRYKDLYVIDFSNVRSSEEIHRILLKELDFPDYYGCNWSAFRDCLTDMLGRPIHVEIYEIDRLERNFEPAAKKLTDILKDFRHYDGDRYADQISIALAVEGQKYYLP